MITGSIVALVTPMASDGSIDWQALEQLVEWHVESGTDSIVAVGTTGESATLDVQEHTDVIKHVVEVAAGRLPIIAGTGANSTSEAIELTEAAAKHGAAACLLVAPYYNKPPQEGLYQHHVAIAQAVDIPQILYNVPGRTAVDMLPETVVRLAEIPNIVAIKEATGDLDRAKWLIENTPEDFLIYSGDDATCVELMLLGGNGNISVTANVAPEEMAELCRLAITGEAEAARALNAKVAGLHETLFIESSPIPVKWALQQMGKIAEGIRLPLVPLSEASKEPVLAVMKQAEIL